MKIKLLTNGGYAGFKNVVLPVIVHADVHADVHGAVARVPEYELERIGCDMTQFHDEDDPFWPFRGPKEFEVVE